MSRGSTESRPCKLRWLGWCAAAGSVACGQALVPVPLLQGCSSEGDETTLREDAGQDSGHVQASPRGPQCVRVACLNDADCCRSVPSACQAQCLAGKCSFACGGELTCPRSLPVCNAGKCAQCAQDSDCLGNSSCVGGVCLGRCQRALDCPSLFACVNGLCQPNRCDEASECKTATSHPQAACSSEGTCEATCSQNDECAGFDRLLNNAHCAGGRCLAPGCSSDDQCYAAFLALSPNDPSLQDAGAYVKCVPPP
jgi:hypothetical protein